MNALAAKRIMLSGIVAVLILMSLTVLVALAAAPPLVLPTGPVFATFSDFDIPSATSKSRLDVTLSGFSGNYNVNTVTTYVGWCLEDQLPTPSGPPPTVTLFSTYDPNLPITLTTFTDPTLPNNGNPIPWKQLNYLLNNTGAATRDDIQAAIWYLFWGDPASLPPPFNQPTIVPSATAIALANAANANGAGFVPAPGQIIAVLLIGGGDTGIGLTFTEGFVWQDSVIELQVPGDLGDLPATYPTLLANNGPSHQLGGSMFLGQCVDGELDGQPNATATGDDTAVGLPVSGNQSCTDDEDGVTRVAGKGGGGWTNGTVASNNGGAVQVTITGGPACLGAFFDFAHSGTTLTSAPLLDTGSAGVSQPIVAGTYTFYFDIPANTFNGTTSQPIYARFRVTSPVNNLCTNSPAFSPTGPAPDGEVEDYQWPFNSTAVTLRDLQATALTNGERLMELLRNWLQR